MTHVKHESPQRTEIGRRQVLKAMIATGGALAASAMLPAEWTKPVVEMGVLPAHAQVSTIYELVTDDGCRFLWTEAPGMGGINGSTVQLVVTLGSGNVAGIDVTLELVPVPGPGDPPVFQPALPITVATDINGYATFPDLWIVGLPGQPFGLLFSCTDPVTQGLLTVQCDYTLPPGDVVN